MECAFCEESTFYNLDYAPVSSCELQANRVYKYRTFVVNSGITITIRQNAVLEVENEFRVKSGGNVNFKFRVKVIAKSVHVETAEK